MVSKKPLWLSPAGNIRCEIYIVSVCSLGLLSLIKKVTGSKEEKKPPPPQTSWYCKAPFLGSFLPLWGMVVHEWGRKQLWKRTRASSRLSWVVFLQCVHAWCQCCPKTWRYPGKRMAGTVKALEDERETTCLFFILCMLWLLFALFFMCYLYFFFFCNEFFLGVFCSPPPPHPPKLGFLESVGKGEISLSDIMQHHRPCSFHSLITICFWPLFCLHAIWWPITKRYWMVSNVITWSGRCGYIFFLPSLSLSYSERLSNRQLLLEFQQTSLNCSQKHIAHHAISGLHRHSFHCRSCCKEMLFI